MEMFTEADFLVLENRSTSQARSFKVFDEKQVFPNKKTAPDRLQPPQAEEKHDECDYETEEEHVLKAHELMLEDLHESIQFFVDNRPRNLVNNLRLKKKAT